MSDPVHASGTPAAAPLNEDIAGLYREVALLKIALLNTKKVWYRDMSTMIAALALVFSLGTTVVSYRRTQAQDVLANHQALRGVLQRLSSIPRENAEAVARLKPDPPTLVAVSSSFNQENAMLVTQAIELIHSLPDAAVTASELYDVGVALDGSSDYARAKDFFDKAAQRATDLNIDVAAQRSSAASDFATGKIEAGREAFRKALDLPAKWGVTNQFLIASTNIYTVLGWSQSEATSGNLQATMEQIAHAREIVKPLPFTPTTKQFEDMINAQENAFKQTPLPIPAGAIPGGLTPPNPGNASSTLMQTPKS